MKQCIHYQQQSWHEEDRIKSHTEHVPESAKASEMIMVWTLAQMYFWQRINMKEQQ